MIQILLTTRLSTVAEHNFNPKFFLTQSLILGLNEQESMELLRKKVFGEEGVPPQLRKAAEKIARNCGGLPLMIVTVADLISKANNYNPLFWNEVAEKPSSVFMDAYNQISEVLFPTYDVFPQRVKMILIYAGAFRQDQIISVPFLINLLSAEGFSKLRKLKKNVNQTFNEFGWKCGVLDLQKDRFFDKIRVYSWWSHLFNREASEDKFLHVLTSGTDFLRGGIKGQCRLQLSMFPSRLQQLCLKGLGYSWKHMKAIGSLPNLKVLSLHYNAFRGPKWGTKRMSFLSLKSLLIEDCDLVQWKPRCGSFANLELVEISHCYKLKEVYWPSAARSDGRIVMENCHPLAVACAEQSKFRNNQLKVISNFDKKIKP